MELLTNKEVEERVIKRVQNKAMAYGQEITDETSIGSSLFNFFFNWVFFLKTIVNDNAQDTYTPTHSGGLA